MLFGGVTLLQSADIRALNPLVAPCPSCCAGDTVAHFNATSLMRRLLDRLTQPSPEVRYTPLVAAAVWNEPTVFYGFARRGSGSGHGLRTATCIRTSFAAHHAMLVRRVELDRTPRPWLARQGLPVAGRGTPAQVRLGAAVALTAVARPLSRERQLAEAHLLDALGACVLALGLSEGACAAKRDPAVHPWHECC